MECADSKVGMDSISKNKGSAVGTEKVSKWVKKYWWSLPISVFSLYNILVVQGWFPL